MSVQSVSVEIVAFLLNEEVINRRQTYAKAIHEQLFRCVNRGFKVKSTFLFFYKLRLLTSVINYALAKNQRKKYEHSGKMSNFLIFKGFEKLSNKLVECCKPGKKRA